MKDYAQPSFYRFTEDSLKLARFVAERVQSAENVLDLGAGCGVLGLELAIRIKPKRLLLVELQKEFEPFLLQNLTAFCPRDTRGETMFSEFSRLRAERFELIVGNPPYFLPGQGRASPNPRRDVARTFVIDGWKELLKCLTRHLGKKAFLVVRDDPDLLSHIEGLLEETELELEVHGQGKLLFLEFCLDED